jgi:hypothetical protein
MRKNNTVVLRTPSASNSTEKMVNEGVGFIDTVNLERDEKRTVVHFLPEQPLTKGKTIMVFPARGRELPVELTGHTRVGERDPGYVLHSLFFAARLFLIGCLFSFDGASLFDREGIMLAPGIGRTGSRD